MSIVDVRPGYLLTRCAPSLDERDLVARDQNADVALGPPKDRLGLGDRGTQRTVVERVRGSAARGCGSEPVAAHHCSDGFEVGRPSGGGIEHCTDLTEVIGAEHARRDDRERDGVDVAGVVEAVDGAARDADGLAGADVDRSTFDRPGQDALEPVDRLLVAVVTVWSRNLAAGRDVEFEHRDRSGRLLALDQKPNRHRSDPDLLAYNHSYPVLSETQLSGLVRDEAEGGLNGSTAQVEDLDQQVSPARLRGGERGVPPEVVVTVVT